VPTAVWAGEPELTAEVWLWAEDAVAVGSTVTARLRDAAGAILGQDTWTLGESVGVPRAVGTLRVAADGVPPDAVLVWDVTWRNADGTELDRELMLAGSGADLAPLLDLPSARLDVASAPDGVRVTHRAGPLVAGLQLLDDRPLDADGWTLIDGDPRPLLPGESRWFAVEPADPGTSTPLLLESWNTDPVRIDLPPEPPQ
jgi:beta-mannosidase